MNVLIIPEDFRKDQYILKPIVSAMMRECGRPRVKVEVCRDPNARGVDQATKWEFIEKVLDRYQGMVDLYLLIVDRDNDSARRTTLTSIETQTQSVLPQPKCLLGENAWQEVEVWALAGHDLLPGWTWNEIRSERDPKENYFIPLARSRGLLSEPGEGRKTLSTEAARQYSRIRQLCPEDVAKLENRIRAWLQNQDNTGLPTS